MKPRKAQLKIQEMAFVLVAFIIFFVILGLFYFSVRIADMGDEVKLGKEQKTMELIRKISATPELGWRECSNCVDLDKALAMKEKNDVYSYNKLFDLDYLVIERIYPEQNEAECQKSNYPSCNKITIVKMREEYGVSYSSFVALCRWDNSINSEVCELGRIYAAGKGVLNETF